MIQATLRNRVVIEFSDSAIPPFVFGAGTTPMQAAVMVKNAKRFIDKQSALRWLDRCRAAINKGDKSYV